jgi:hypothetical protein
MFRNLPIIIIIITISLLKMYIVDIFYKKKEKE